MKKAFTLIELMVVMAIIGILAGVLTVSFSNSGESAKTAQCLANMRNLASACQTYAATEGHYPLACSIERSTLDESEGVSNAKERFYEVSGWISWNSQGVYRNSPNSHQASTSWMMSLYSTDEEASLYSLTNGVLWKYLSGNRNAYVCSKHMKKYASKNTRPAWSYLMNQNFGWDYTQGGRPLSDIRIEYGHLKRADRMLLFSEIPFDGVNGSWQPDESASGMDGDCVLQYDQTTTASAGNKNGSRGNSCGASENIGFNHKQGDYWIANVVFADGHGEKLRMPKKGLSDMELKQLTAWLCMGEDVSFDGQNYRRMDN